MDNFQKKFIQEIGAQLQSFSKLAIEQYTPIVDEIIVQQIKDESIIQKVLEGLLDFCYDMQILYQYRKLCRYCLDINPQMTLEYIEYYKEMYDPDSENFGINTKKDKR